LRALAGDVEFIAHRGRVVGIPSVVGTAQRVGTVEYERTHQLRMPQREYLFEIGSVGISVEVDAPDLQRIEDRREIIGGKRRAVERGAIAQGSAAGADQI